MTTTDDKDYWNIKNIMKRNYDYINSKEYHDTSLKTFGQFRIDRIFDERRGIESFDFYHTKDDRMSHITMTRANIFNLYEELMKVFKQIDKETIKK